MNTPVDLARQGIFKRVLALTVREFFGTLSTAINKLRNVMQTPNASQVETSVDEKAEIVLEPNQTALTVVVSDEGDIERITVHQQVGSHVRRLSLSFE